MNTLRCALAAAAVAQLAFASPIAQGMDLDALAALPPPPTYTEVIGLTAQTVAVNQASLIASVVAAVSDTPLSTAAVEKRSAAPSTTTSSTASISTTASSSTSSSTASTCWGGIKQAKGYGPTSKPDTPAAFAANPVYGSIANAAPTPAGFTQVFSNLQASSQDYGYLGYTTLTTYDTNSCAAQCQSITDCYSFNIYFERDPTIQPGTGRNCLNPKSTTNIKCAFWGAPISNYTATNSGQWRDNFEVLIAGSNGYVTCADPTPAGYTAPEYVSTGAINAPLDCNGDDTYMGVRIFQSGPFDINLCAAACTSQSNYNLAYPPATGEPQLCTFFNTYMLYKNNIPQAQYCSLYNQTWDASYATNAGQYDGAGNHYTVGFSHISSNATCPGVCTPVGSSSGSSTGSGVQED